MQNKKGQGLSTNAIILIILGVVILVVLILGFTLGWDKIAPWFGGGSNVDKLVQQCTAACATQDIFYYCTTQLEVKVKGEEPSPMTCDLIAKADASKNYGLEQCQNFACVGPE